MPTVSIQSLTKYYGDLRAIENISLSVQDKEFLTVLGPSGCGKTTLLRLIAGLEGPNKGDILIDGNSVLDTPTQDRDIAMVFQNYSLYNHMTVYDNLAFPLRMRKSSAQDISNKVKSTAETLGISHILERKPKKLSGGEQQRVALGRAIVREPKVFLMDEPLTFLDPKLRTQMRLEIKTLQRKLGVTTIYVTHDQAEAMTMSDRIALLENGVLQQLGTPFEVYNKPKNQFVASFLGSPTINLINCIYSESDDKAFLEIDDFQLDIKNLKNKNIEKNTHLILGVRPEDITLSKKRIDNSIESEVYLIEPLGSELNIILKIGDNIINVKTDSGLDVKIGEKIWMIMDKEKIHLFSKEGERI